MAGGGRERAVDRQFEQEMDRIQAGIEERIEREKAVALAEAILTVEGLLGGESARLRSARLDVTARSMAGFDVAMLAAELARVVADQEERIGRLEERLEELGRAEDEPAAPTEAKG
jgi:hypothetical protein